MKRILLILLLCGALTLAGCDRPAGDGPAPAAPTAGTETAGTLPGTTGPASAAVTSAETAPSTGAIPTETTPTDPTRPAVRELGGPAFTLAGQTFTMGEAPDRLLAFLGEPEETFSCGDSLYDGTDHFYHYKDIWVAAFQPTGSEGSVLTDVYFITERYAVDGISVGSTAADLRRAVALPESDPGAVAYPKFCYQEFAMHAEIGGYGYLLDREFETPGNTYWAFLFTEEDDPQRPADAAPILCVHIYFIYPFAMY